MFGDSNNVAKDLARNLPRRSALKRIVGGVLGVGAVQWLAQATVDAHGMGVSESSAYLAAEPPIQQFPFLKRTPTAAATATPTASPTSSGTPTISPPFISHIARYRIAGESRGGILLYGQGFTGVTRVTVSSMPSYGWTVDSDSQITIPGTWAWNGAENGNVFYAGAPVQVIGPGGTSNTARIPDLPIPTSTAISTPIVIATPTISSKATATPTTISKATATASATVTPTLTSVAAPAITSISPASGPATGGNMVTLTGLNLAGATAVIFGGVFAPIVTNSKTQITVIAPPGSGRLPVTVTTPDGTSKSEFYTYT